MLEVAYKDIYAEHTQIDCLTKLKFSALSA